MDLKMNVKWKIKVDGKEYGSLEEMPAPVREAYKGAKGIRPGPRSDGASAAATTRIVFNGEEYAGVDAMPPEIRETFLSLMKAVGSGEALPGDAPVKPIWSKPVRQPVAGGPAPSRGPGPISPQSISARKLVVGAAILALIAALWSLSRG